MSPNLMRIDPENLNLDYIINTVSIAVKNNEDSNEEKPYSKEFVEAYSGFISQYNQIKNYLLN